jgi:hypothetical protein
MFKRAIPKCTAEQQARQDKARAAGCIACRIEMCEQPFNTEINHITVSGRQLGQDFTEALCQWHHRGICKPGYTANDMQIEYGPSLLHNKRHFVRIYGDWRERLSFQNELIGYDKHVVARPERKRTSLSSKKIVERAA